MAGVSAEQMILFIASMLVAASVAGVLTNEVGHVSQAITAKGLDASKQVRTDVEIISDAGANDIYNGTTGNVTIYVKNTGSQHLDGRAGEIDVLVDGRYQQDLDVTVIGGTTWDPTDVVEVRIHDPGLPSGDHRLKLVVNGDEEVFRFRS